MLTNMCEFFPSYYNRQHIVVKSLTGRHVNIDLDLKSATVDDLFEAHCKQTGVPKDQGRFIFAGKQLMRPRYFFSWPALQDGQGALVNTTVQFNSNTLSSYGIQKDSTIHSVSRLRGGGPPPPAFCEEHADSDESLEALRAVLRFTASPRITCAGREARSGVTFTSDGYTATVGTEAMVELFKMMIMSAIFSYVRRYQPAGYRPLQLTPLSSPSYRLISPGPGTGGALSPAAADPSVPAAAAGAADLDV